MADDGQQKASLAYRTARDKIWAGIIPPKYLRIVPYVTGPRVLEIGAAEGVLSLLLAETKPVVTALELREDRFNEGLRLKQRWQASGKRLTHCTLRLGDIRSNHELLTNVDSLVAVRVIYYLRDDAVGVMRAAYLAGVREVVLCGNRNRAKVFHMEPDSERGRFDRLASVEGMTDVLQRGGYRIKTIFNEGDPIVVGAA